MKCYRISIRIKLLLLFFTLSFGVIQAQSSNVKISIKGKSNDSKLSGKGTFMFLINSYFFVILALRIFGFDEVDT